METQMAGMIKTEFKHNEISWKQDGMTATRMATSMGICMITLEADGSKLVFNSKDYEDRARTAIRLLTEATSAPYCIPK